MLVDQLVATTAPWAAFYGNHVLAQNAVTFGHLGGMVVSGGLAVATDRSVVSKRYAAPEDRARHLKTAPTVHRLVMFGLSVTLVTGMMMFAADLEYLIAARSFWVKMGLLGLLFGNGALILRQERVLGATHPRIKRHWHRLRHLSMCSIALWMAVVLAGVVMSNA